MNAHSKLLEKLVILEQELFTGALQIMALDSKQWNIYLYQGRLVWIEGGSHVYRFWQRHLSVICPQIDIQLLERERILSNSRTDYYIINVLLKYKLAHRQQINKLIEQKFEDILFDILQVENKSKLHFYPKKQSAHSLLKNHFNLTLDHLMIYQILSKVYEQWSLWVGKGLASCSPNLAPLLKPETKLDQQVSPLIFQNMKRMLDGKKTLRDLALQTDKDVFEITCALVPYFFQGYIRLLEIPDLPGIQLTNNSKQKNTKNFKLQSDR